MNTRDCANSSTAKMAAQASATQRSTPHRLLSPWSSRKVNAANSGKLRLRTYPVNTVHKQSQQSLRRSLVKPAPRGSSVTSPRSSRSGGTATAAIKPAAALVIAAVESMRQPGTCFDAAQVVRSPQLQAQWAAEGLPGQPSLPTVTATIKAHAAQLGLIRKAGRWAWPAPESPAHGSPAASSRSCCSDTQSQPGSRAVPASSAHGHTPTPAVPGVKRPRQADLGKGQSELSDLERSLGVLPALTPEQRRQQQNAHLARLAAQMKQHPEMVAAAAAATAGASVRPAAEANKSRHSPRVRKLTPTFKANSVYGSIAAMLGVSVPSSSPSPGKSVALSRDELANMRCLDVLCLVAKVCCQPGPVPRASAKSCDSATAIQQLCAAGPAPKVSRALAHQVFGIGAASAPVSAAELDARWRILSRMVHPDRVDRSSCTLAASAQQSVASIRQACAAAWQLLCASRAELKESG